MKAQELRDKTPAELKEIKMDLLKEQLSLRMKDKSDEPLKTHRFKVIRRSIARIKTILNEQRLAS